MKAFPPPTPSTTHMEDHKSVVSNASAPEMNEMLALLDAPVAPKKAKVVRLSKKAKEALPVAPVVVVAPVEDAPVEEDDTPDWSALVEEADQYIGQEAGGVVRFVEMYKEMKQKYNALIESQKKAKNSNSPDIENGIHMRMIGGVKTKTKYIFPYQADGGKSIVKEMKDGQKCIGVSTTQKNNSKGSCKIADYDLIWVNNKIVKDTKTGKSYPHKDGKFAIMNEDDMTTFNVRMMIVAE